MLTHAFHMMVSVMFPTIKALCPQQQKHAINVKAPYADTTWSRISDFRFDKICMDFESYDVGTHWKSLGEAHLMSPTIYIFMEK